MDDYKDYISSVLCSFAVGDALGMATEFMNREYISDNFGLVEEFVSPDISFIHADLKMGQITDDTEQTLFLLERYIKDGFISPYNTAEALLKWIEDTGAVEKGYVGPNSLKALNDVKRGIDLKLTGKNGTTCGSSMRVLAPVLFMGKCGEEQLKISIADCGIPTHNTNLAMEGSMALGFAFNAAISGAKIEEIIDFSIRGGEIGKKISANEFVGPSSTQRIKYLKKEIETIRNDTELINFLYYVFGTTMETYDVVPASIAIFLHSGKDVWKAIKIGASIGGDTDTIAAISGALCAAYSHSNNIPENIFRFADECNGIKMKITPIVEGISKIWRIKHE